MLADALQVCALQSPVHDTARFLELSDMPYILTATRYVLLTQRRSHPNVCCKVRPPISRSSRGSHRSAFDGYLPSFCGPCSVQSSAATRSSMPSTASLTRPVDSSPEVETGCCTAAETSVSDMMRSRVTFQIAAQLSAFGQKADFLAVRALGVTGDD